MIASSSGRELRVLAKAIHSFNVCSGVESRLAAIECCGTTSCRSANEPIADIRLSRHKGSMRATATICVLLLAVGCNNPGSEAKIDRVELRVSGWSSLDVEVHSRGGGKYHLSEPPPHGSRGSFPHQPQQFAALVERLQPFRSQSEPYSEASARKFILSECPDGVPFTYDAGAVWVRWVGPTLDDHFLLDLGCDAERNAARNRELLDIVESLPVPRN